MRWALPEAVDAQGAAVRHLGTYEGPVTDDPGAQERRELGVRIPVRELQRVVGGHCREFGVSTVRVPPRVARLPAEILEAATARRAPTTGVAQPGDTDAISGGTGRGDGVAHGDNLAHHFVTGNDPRSVRGKVTLGDM